MKRLALILFLCGPVLLPVARGAAAPNPVDDLMRQAQGAVKAGKFDDALQLYEKMFTEHPEASNHWFDVQINIAQALAKKGDLSGAAQAAHLCLDGASDAQSFDAAVMFTATILSAQDKNVDRANQFIAFAQTGGKTNPMDAVGYPSLPDREKAFAAIRRQVGDDANASRLRAFTYLFTGKPKDALAQFAEEFRRSDNISNLQLPILDLVNIGLRDMRGHRVGLDQDLQFVIFGPNGPDGKPGTADDLTDPFAPWLPAPPAAGEGGLSGIDAGGLATLHQVRDAAQLYGGDPLLFPDIRLPALTALQRSTSALDGWGAPGRKDWYLDRALGLGGMPLPDEGTRGLLLAGAQLSARGRACHLGGLYTLWNEIDADCAANNIPSDKPIVAARAQFDRICTVLGHVLFPKISLNPLKKPATF
jgi:tetratricopeptide (TPR) repeat protein